MVQTRFLLALRSVFLLATVILMAAGSSGVMQPIGWLHWSDIEPADAQPLSASAPGRGRMVASADNGASCDPRPRPRIQTTSDVSGALQVTISAAIASDSERALLREIQINPLQNAAVDVGPFVGRTTPLAYTVPSGSQQVLLRVTRIVPNQPSQVTVLLIDDCGEWRTFVGGGTGIAIAPPAATATPIPIVPGQPYGSIPISLMIFGSSQGQYPPGSRPRVQIVTRRDAACTLAVTWPNGQRETLPTQMADKGGACFFRPTVPLGMSSGTATALATVQDVFGLNVQQVPFLVGGTLTGIPPGDNILRVDPRHDDDGEPAPRLRHHNLGNPGSDWHDDNLDNDE